MLYVNSIPCLIYQCGLYLSSVYLSPREGSYGTAGTSLQGLALSALLPLHLARASSGKAEKWRE